MVIFYSYVSLPEGIDDEISWQSKASTYGKKKGQDSPLPSAMAKCQQSPLETAVFTGPQS